MDTTKGYILFLKVEVVKSGVPGLASGFYESLSQELQLYSELAFLVKIK